MTAPAHRVGDLRDRPPAQDPRRWWTPEWWRISRAVIPPAHGPMIIESNPPRPPLALGATGRGVKRAGPVPGHHWSRRGPPGESMVLGRGPAQGRLPRADVVGSPYSMAPGARSTRPAGRAPGTSSGQSGEQPPGPGHHGPVRSRSARTGRTPAPVSRNRRATSRPSTGLFLSSVALNRRQSFHQGLYRPLNTPAQPTVSRAIKALTGAISRTLVVLLLTAEEVPEDCDFRGGRHPLPLPGLAQAPRSVVGRARARGDKTLILVRLDGGFMWASDPYPGSMHNVAALDASGLLEGMDPSGWIGDKGYVGRGMITPHKKPPNGELSETAKEANRSVNRIRQVVERTIAHIKSWRILHTPYRRPLETFEQTITAALALYSFKTTPE